MSLISTDIYRSFFFFMPREALLVKFKMLS